MPIVLAGLSSCVSAPPPGVTIDLFEPVPAITGDWYRGDLHAHSTHSDGDSPVDVVIRVAAERGLDFFELTDHDTSMNGTTPHWEDPSYASDQLVLLYAVEWTSKRGHANVISAAPYDYAPFWSANRSEDAAAAIDAARTQGVLFSINHPVRSWFVWSYGFDELVDNPGDTTVLIEVWNGPFRAPTSNRRAVRGLWDGLHAEGARVVGVGGSDSHQIEGFQRKFNLVGAPTTWVFAAEPTGPAILAGIRAGHVSLSVSPDAGRLDFLADSDGDGSFESMSGDTIPYGRRTLFAVRVSAPGSGQPAGENGAGDAASGSDRGRNTAVVYKNGEVFARFRLAADGGSAAFVDTPADGDFYRVELHGAPDVRLLQRAVMGRMLALTNPIYAGDW